MSDDGSAATIEFFWDAASPYTYLAATQIEAVAARVGADVRWRPFLIGKVFEAAGNRMPAAIPAKGKYLFGDVTLWARHYGVPFTFPKVFPVNSVLAQRVACVALERGHGADFALAVMKAYWGEGRDISQRETLAAVCTSLGLDAEAMLTAATEPPAKDQLRANTEEASRRGAFGAPTFFIGEQMFWGNDRLPLMEAYLKGELAA